jgi:hypothetical protein
MEFLRQVVDMAGSRGTETRVRDANLRFRICRVTQRVGELVKVS